MGKNKHELISEMHTGPDGRDWDLMCKRCGIRARQTFDGYGRESFLVYDQQNFDNCDLVLIRSVMKS
jgi:hypothetical protein